MGVLRKGIFDGFEGKTGPLVGRKVNGKSVLSAVPHRTEKEPSQAQIDQQLKFELVVNTLRRLNNLIRVGFKHAGYKSAFNAAMKYNFKRIVTGSSPDFGIDYSQLVFSKGSLAGPNSPAISLGSNAVLFSWLPEAQTQFNWYTDRASFVVYCPAKNVFVVMANAAERQTLGYQMAIPPDFEGLELYCFMSFTREDGKAVSDSVYLGVV